MSNATNIRNIEALAENQKTLQRKNEEQDKEIAFLKNAISTMKQEIQSIKQGVIMANVQRGSGPTST